MQIELQQRTGCHHSPTGSYHHVGRWLDIAADAAVASCRQLPQASTNLMTYVLLECMMYIEMGFDSHDNCTMHLACMDPWASLEIFTCSPLHAQGRDAVREMHEGARPRLLIQHGGYGICDIHCHIHEHLQVSIQRLQQQHLSRHQAILSSTTVCQCTDASETADIASSQCPARSKA